MVPCIFCRFLLMSLCFHPKKYGKIAQFCYSNNESFITHIKTKEFLKISENDTP